MEINWAYIASVAGAGAVTTLFVELIKSIAGVEINKWWLRLLTYVFGTGLLTLGSYFVSGIAADSVLLAVINGALVYFVATGEYHTIVKELFKK